jgi:F-box/WD-40 domain protein 7
MSLQFCIFFLAIEPRFQRDFISLLPPELALHVLSKLEPKDLVSATQTCRTWRQLADDNTIWRQKCREENVKGKQNALG